MSQPPWGVQGKCGSAGSRSKNSATNQNRAVFSYGGCTHLVRSVYGVRVRSGYGARGFSQGRGVKIALKGPRNLFRGLFL